MPEAAEDNVRTHTIFRRFSLASHDDLRAWGGELGAAFNGRALEVRGIATMIRPLDLRLADVSQPRSDYQPQPPQPQPP